MRTDVPRLIRRGGFMLVAGCVASVALFGLAYVRWGWSRVPASTPVARAIDAGFLPWHEHDAIVRAHGWPHILRVSGAPGEVLYYGALHTRDPDSPQIAQIESLWDEFRPTVALVESRLGLYLGGLRGGVRMFGEPGAVYALARRDDVPVFSLEPEYADEVAALLAEFTPEQVALFFTTRVYWNERSTAPEGDADALAAHLLAKRTDVEGLRDALPDIAAVDALWARECPDLPGWRIPAHGPGGAAEENPERWSATFFPAIENADREVRGRHMVRLLADLAQGGERVFAVVGGSHVIRQEPMLREVFEGATITREPEIVAAGE